MGQQFKSDEASRPIKRAGVIRPKEPVTVYATELIGNAKSNNIKTGDAVVLHRVTADRWIAMGKATATPPQTKKAKEA